MEEAGRAAERHPREEPGHRGEPPFADQGPALGGRRQEGEEVDGGQPPLEDQPAQPVAG